MIVHTGLQTTELPRFGFSVVVVAAALSVLHSTMTPAIADGGAPTDQEIAQTIARGLRFLRSTQSEGGAWNEPSQGGHRLGVTALAGLALMENGVPTDEASIRSARGVVADLARSSNQTYDLALAILFLARQQKGHHGESDALIQELAGRLSAGGHGGIWTYNVPVRTSENDSSRNRSRRGGQRQRGRRLLDGSGFGDHSNTQFALLGVWAAGRHGFDPDDALESIDDHFRATQLEDGHWGYQPGMGGSEAMSCAGLLALAITAARPSMAEHQTARARGAALSKDPSFVAALHAVASDARRADRRSDIYYLWSLERVCVALGLRSLEDFDWYGHGARILLDRQADDGGWPHDRWGRLPNTCLALLFLRKANLAFELDRVLRLALREPGPAAARDAVQPTGAENESTHPTPSGPPSVGPVVERGADDVSVIVTGASEKAFPQISVQFEVKEPDGTYLARRPPRRFSCHGRGARR